MTTNHSSPLTETQIDQLHQKLFTFSEQFKAEMQKVIVGQEKLLDFLVLALFCDGHVLLTGVPGLAKTLVVKSLSHLFHLDFNRIQCTPDLMPADVLGGEILEESQEGRERNFRFLQGPVFTNLLLVDEINRTSPRTQSALLQSMQERQVTISGKSYELKPPFIVFATQNPIESEGTYLLPEAQLDRFLFNLEIHYPSMQEEIQIATIDHRFSEIPIETLFSRKELLEMQYLSKQIPIAPHLVEWIVRFVRATRPSEKLNKMVESYIEWGAGIRASQNIVIAAKASALLSNRSTVIQEDILLVLSSVLRHRIIVNFMGQSEGITSDHIISELIEQFTK